MKFDRKKWTSVETKLPTDTCQFFSKCLKESTPFHIGVFDSTTGEWWSNGEKINRVTHWKHLIKPHAKNTN